MTAISQDLWLNNGHKSILLTQSSIPGQPICIFVDAPAQDADLVKCTVIISIAFESRTRFKDVTHVRAGRAGRVMGFHFETI